MSTEFRRVRPKRVAVHGIPHFGNGFDDEPLFPDTEELEELPPVLHESAVREEGIGQHIFGDDVEPPNRITPEDKRLEQIAAGL